MEFNQPIIDPNNSERFSIPPEGFFLKAIEAALEGYSGPTPTDTIKREAIASKLDEMVSGYSIVEIALVARILREMVSAAQNQIRESALQKIARDLGITIIEL